MMKETELFQKLESSGLNVAYDHFDRKVEPPFILYRNTDTSIFFADDHSYYRENQYIVDLVTAKKDVALEEQLEATFDENVIAFTKFEDYIESERVYQIRYFI